MRGLRTLAGLQSGQRALVLRTLGLVACVRAGLFIFTLKRLQRVLDVSERLRLNVPPETSVRDLVWAVRAAAKRIPAATCLTQSLALQFLMKRSGRAANVRIGVAKDPAAGFRSHAWVEHAGAPLLSDPAELEQYSLVLIMEPEGV